MKKVIDIDREISSRLERFTEESDFLVLLDTIVYALIKKRFACDKFAPAWALFRSCNDLAGLLDKFALLLAKIEIYVEKKNIVPAKPPADSEINKIRQWLEGAGQHEDGLRKRFETTYSWFKPSWALGDFLNTIYPDELNPGRVIAKYIDLLFPRLPGHGYSGILSGYTNKPLYKLPCGTAVHTFLKKLASDLVLGGEILEEYKEAAKNIVAAIIDSDWEELTTKQQVEQHLIAGLLLPRDIFFSWLFGVNEGVFGCSGEMYPHALKIFLSYFMIGQGNQPLITINEGGLGSSGLLPKDLITELAKMKVITYQDMAFVFGRIGEFGIKFDNELSLLVSKVLSTYRYFRLTYLNGMSPIDDHDASNINIVIKDFIPLEDIDLTITLADGRYELSDLSLILEHANHAAPSMDFIEEINAYEWKKILYFDLFRKANSEGLPEFANALLSLYLMGRALVCNCRMGNMGELQALLDQAARMPGKMIVEHTIKLLVSFAHKYFPSDRVAKLGISTLQQFIHKKARLYPLQTNNKNVKSDIRSMRCEPRLINELGEESWNKLSENSRNYLISAAYQWDSNAAEIHFGIKDVSGIIIQYIKAIESELCCRLTTFHTCQAYREYCDSIKLPPPIKPELGWALNILKDYKRYPDVLKQELFKSSLKTYKDEKLVWKLKGIKDKFRNIAAHGQPCPPIKYSELMQELFDNKTLVNLISTLE